MFYFYITIYCLLVVAPFSYLTFYLLIKLFVFFEFSSFLRTVSTLFQTAFCFFPIFYGVDIYELILVKVFHVQLLTSYISEVWEFLIGMMVLSFCLPRYFLRYKLGL